MQTLTTGQIQHLIAIQTKSSRQSFITSLVKAGIIKSLSGWCYTDEKGYVPFGYFCDRELKPDAVSVGLANATGLGRFDDNERLLYAADQLEGMAV